MVILKIEFFPLSEIEDLRRLLAALEKEAEMEQRNLRAMINDFEKTETVLPR
jgi:hypothetical protein